MCQELGDDSLGRTAPWEREDGAVGGLRWWTGCHTSTSGGMEKAVINAAAIGQPHPSKKHFPSKQFQLLVSRSSEYRDVGDLFHLYMLLQADGEFPKQCCRTDGHVHARKSQPQAKQQP